MLTILLLTLLLRSADSQPVDYQQLFGDDWKRAEMFVKENRSWIDSVLSRNHISYPIAVAVIFPELVRYSALRDKMEITLLKTLYVNLGEEYANFSIGQFQMKPSFAEAIRELAPSFINRRSGIIFLEKYEYHDIKSYRKSIVADLEETRSEFKYLIAFIKICEKKFHINRKSDIVRLKFIATAYNYGIDKSTDQIEKMIDKKYFNTHLFSTVNYSYADVSLFWYNQYMTGN
jgi:hypothetical protein